MVVAIAILAVTASLAAPSFIQWIDAASVKKVARQIITDFQLAKMKAISEGVQYRVSFDEGTNSYAIEKGNKSTGSDSWTRAGLSRRLSDKDNSYYSKGVVLKQNSPTDALILQPDGSSSMGTIKVSSGSCTDGKILCRQRRCERCLTAIRTGRIAFAE